MGANGEISYFFYPETARRSLEEIDLIFAKGYIENISYVKAGKELPSLSVEDMEQLAIQYGLTEDVAGRKTTADSDSDAEKAESGHVAGLAPGKEN